jgi:tRNA(Ile)-lysidine synthase
VLSELESYIGNNGLFSRENKLLLALSGGADSVVLTQLLKNAGYNLSLAHCNFWLRGSESEADEQFCRELASEIGIEIFVNHFDVEAARKKSGASIQMAARQLRYDWFSELIRDHAFDFLVTAHHANDLVESVFLNLLRGTGIKGMKGIAEISGNRVRPLLRFSKETILAFAREKNISYRQDASNLDDKYERNFIRLNVIPHLKKLNNRLEETFLRNSFRFSEEAGIVQAFIAKKKEELCSTDQEGILRVSKHRLGQEAYRATLLHGILEEMGFNETQERNILKNITGEATPGKRYASPTHELTVDREYILIRPKRNNHKTSLTINNFEDLLAIPVLHVETLSSFSIPRAGELVVQRSRLVFPLVLRAWEKGDQFRPFGMKGYKLVSDFLKEQKLHAFEKEACRLLVNGNSEIIWIACYRSDDRYKVNESSDDLIKITYTGK